MNNNDTLKNDLCDEIVAHRTQIYYLEKIKKVIEDAIDDTIEMTIKTRHFDYILAGTTKNKQTLKVEAPALLSILDSLIAKEKIKIDDFVNTYYNILSNKEKTDGE